MYKYSCVFFNQLEQYVNYPVRYDEKEVTMKRMTIYVNFKQILKWIKIEKYVSRIYAYKYMIAELIRISSLNKSKNIFHSILI